MNRSAWLFQLQVILVLSFSSASNAFVASSDGTNGVTKKEGPLSVHRCDEGSVADRNTPSVWQSVPTIILALSLPLDPASAAAALPITQNQLSSTEIPLSKSEAFKMLPRQPQLSGALKEIRDLQELQDSRLAACEEKGQYWEQCFMFGQSEGGVDATTSGTDRGRMDYQLITPAGALNPPSDVRKVPTW